MSLRSRKEYLQQMTERYHRAKSRQEKSRLIDQACETLLCHRKHAIRVLNARVSRALTPVRRHRPLQYQEAIPAIQIVWEALDYPCSERLHPALNEMAEHLARHGELYLDNRIRQQLADISRATLARRLSGFASPKPKRRITSTKARGRLRSEVPVDRYDSTKLKPGALEVDLVEHNGGSSLGHFAYTLNVVDVVTQYSRRWAVLGRGQKGVFQALRQLIAEWPFVPWGLHSDNGGEFLNDHLLRYTRDAGLKFTRSRPYKKNDNPHIEQKNRQLVREMVGYARYDTLEHVAWLNGVYELLDLYVNLFLPGRKIVAKTREAGKTKKHYDQARAPYHRLIESGLLDPVREAELTDLRQRQNPRHLHRHLEDLLAFGIDAGLAVPDPVPVG